MASIHKISTGWQVRNKTPQRKSRKKNFARKPDALRFKAEKEVELVTNTYVDPSDGRRCFGDYARELLGTKRANVTERTWINLDGRLRNYLLPILGDRQLSSIRPQDVRLLVAELTTVHRLDPSTVRPIYFLLRQVMATAVTDGLMPRTPCVGVELPAEEQGNEMLFLNPEELARLADSVDMRFRALILTAGYTGLRAGELSALKVDRVLSLRRCLSVVESHSEVNGRLVTKSTKTRRRREVPIPATLTVVLAEHIKRFPSEDGFVFTSAEGGPLRHHNFYVRHYKPAVAKAELPEDLRFHDLRHTAASIWIAVGANEKQLESFLGDTSRAIERYRHLFEGHETALMAKVEETMSANLGSVRGPSGVLAPLARPRYHP
jgi:integrase